MRSIHVRLNVLQVVIVTAVLAVSGAYSHHELERDLENRHEELRTGVLNRLATNLPSVLWNFDKAGIGGVLEGEMQSKEVLAIRVFTSSGELVAGRMRMPFGPIVSVGIDTPVEGDPVDTELLYRNTSASTAIRQTELGRAVVNFSREHIDASLRSQAMHKVAEIILLDLIVIAGLSFSLRMVFTPLEQLRNEDYSEPIDLVLLDIMMPHMSGLEVLARLREVPRWRSTPVIMLTAKGQDGDRKRALELGATDFLTKPFSPNKLPARID